MNHLTAHTIARDFITPEWAGLTLKDQANLLGISRSSLYYQLQPVDEKTLSLMNRIDKIHTDWPVYGARKIAKQIIADVKEEQLAARKKHLLGPEDIVIGRKRVRHLMEQMGLEAIYPKPNLSQNNLSHPIYLYLLKGLAITRPNQVWGVDITYIRLNGGFVYLVAIIDWYSRFVLSWKLSTTLEVNFVTEAASEALDKYGPPEIVNVDQGVQFTSLEFIQVWDQALTQISMNHKGRCFDNIFTERFWRTLKYEEVYLRDYQSVWEAEASIEDYINRYNFKRIHQALNYLTPADIYLKYDLLQDGLNQRVVTKFVS